MVWRRNSERDTRHRTLEETEGYWRRPDDGSNQPEDYLNPQRGHSRSRFLLELIGNRLAPSTGALEVGCNVGRNLQHLADSGWAPLAGIEINPEAVRLLHEHQPGLGAADIYNEPAETALTGIEDGSFGLVFTMAVLVHIHPEVAETVFDGMARVCDRTLIVIEDEHTSASWRHFKREYRSVFEGRGLKQVHEGKCGSERSGLPASYVARVFDAPTG